MHCRHSKMNSGSASPHSSHRCRPRTKDQSACAHSWFSRRCSAMASIDVMSSPVVADDNDDDGLSCCCLTGRSGEEEEVVFVRLRLSSLRSSVAAFLLLVLLLPPPPPLVRGGGRMEGCASLAMRWPSIGAKTAGGCVNIAGNGRMASGVVGRGGAGVGRVGGSVRCLGCGGVKRRAGGGGGGRGPAGRGCLPNMVGTTRCCARG